MDPIAQFKEFEKLAWSNFSMLENVTATASPGLVRFAGIHAGAEVLDVGCGTGVLALAAARCGAKVTGVDLTPELVAHAKENAAIMKLEGTWLEGDVEALALPDAKFDFVVSQFGHMFAPRPELALREMLRVLKPGGTIAFATWSPELVMGRVFDAVSKYAPAPPPGMSSPLAWGDPKLVRERLGSAVREIAFTRAAVSFQTLSVQHYRTFLERNLKPMTKLFQMLDASDPAKAALLRQELETIAADYFQDNALRQDYLSTRAVKA